MIDKYKTRDGQIYIISEMKDNHLLNSHRYFAIKRLKLQGANATGTDLFKISLLISSLWAEIDKRDLLKY